MIVIGAGLIGSPLCSRGKQGWCKTFYGNDFYNWPNFFDEGFFFEKQCFANFPILLQKMFRTSKGKKELLTFGVLYVMAV